MSTAEWIFLVAGLEFCVIVGLLIYCKILKSDQKNLRLWYDASMAREDEYRVAAENKNATIRSLTKERDDHDTRLIAQKMIVQNLTQEVHSYKARLADAGSVLNQADDALHLSLQAMEARDLRIDRLCRSEQEFAEKVFSLRKENSELKACNDSMRNRIDELDNSRHSLIQVRSELTERVTALEACNASLVLQISNHVCSCRRCEKRDKKKKNAVA